MPVLSYLLPRRFRKHNTDTDKAVITVELCSKIPELFMNKGHKEIAKSLKIREDDVRKQLKETKDGIETTQQTIQDATELHESLKRKVDAAEKSYETIVAKMEEEGRKLDSLKL